MGKFAVAAERINDRIKGIRIMAAYFIFIVTITV